MSKETLVKKSAVAKAIEKQLKDPFDPRLVKYAKLGGNKVVAYVDARDIQKRLDVVLGSENWEDHYEAAHNGFICTLRLRIDGEWREKSGVADNTKIAPMKGGESGSLKRAAVKFGIGRYFYYFDPIKFTANNVDQWPAIFKPGAPEDWEDVAEMEYGLLSSEGEEFGDEIISNLDAIRAAESTEKLLELFNGLDTGQQAALGKEFKQRSDELIASETAAILKEHAKDAKPKKEAKATEDK